MGAFSKDLTLNSLNFHSENLICGCWISSGAELSPRVCGQETAMLTEVPEKNENKLDNEKIQNPTDAT